MDARTDGPFPGSTLPVTAGGPYRGTRRTAPDKLPRVPGFENAGFLRPAYERVDWGATSVGDPAGWGTPLRIALRLLLTTRFPATLFWGPDLVLLYNEAFVPLIEDKHPAALGSPGREVFPEIWPVIGPMLAGVLAGDGPTWVEDQRLLMRRRGFLEECFFTFSYSPVQSKENVVLGVLDIAAETTRQVLDQRRLRLLTALGDELRDLDGPAELPERALPLLRAADRDLAAVDILMSPAPDAPGVLSLPLTGHGATGQLRVRLSPHLAPDATYLGFLRLLAGSLSSALAAAETRRAERRAALVHRTMSEALQRSLLTEPVQPAGGRIAVRYLPAVHDSRIGGDWYDAFRTADGATCLVVGDVAGHDQEAAAVMGQVRNVLRGTAYALPGTPSAVLSALDRAVRGLAVGTLATAVLAVLDPEPDPSGGRRLRWSNAGHPAPILLDPAGGARLLETRPELILGVNPGARRTDHDVLLPPGSTLLLYTDGLVERRGAHLDAGIGWLLDTAWALAGEPLERLCDELLSGTPGRAEDDIALLALRIPD